jgi:proteasome lid subunit RPN8/RPN11
MNRQIYISEHAFLAVVFAAAEVYRRESYGLLFGYALPGKIVVEGALPYQTAERRFSEVSLFERENKVIQSLIARFPKHEYLGEFHSHADFRGREAQAALTPEDLDSMAPGEIALVVAVNPRLRKRPWATTSDGSLSGTLGQWRFTIAAFTLAPTRRSKPADEPRLHRGEFHPPGRAAGTRRSPLRRPPPATAKFAQANEDGFTPHSELRTPHSCPRPRILRARISCPYATTLLRNA